MISCDGMLERSSSAEDDSTPQPIAARDEPMKAIARTIFRPMLRSLDVMKVILIERTATVKPRQRKDLVGSLVDKRGMIIHHNDSAQ
jgi:hypothetical protein